MIPVVPDNTKEKKALIFSVSNQNSQILRPTRCSTRACKECKIKYVDRLGLEIYVICNCKCHPKVKQNEL